jgi:hypothetical protein
VWCPRLEVLKEKIRKQPGFEMNPAVVELIRDTV